MNVLHIIEPFAGGVITFLVHLTRETPGHRHVVLHGARTTADRVEKVRARFSPGVEFVEWTGVQREINLVADFRAFLFLLRYLRGHEYDVIHLHSSKAGFLGRLTCFILRKRNVIYTPHAAPFVRKDIGWLTRRLYILLEKCAYYLAGPVVSCCESERLAYAERGMKTLCINNGTAIVQVEKNLGEKTLVICSAFMNRQKNPALFGAIAQRFSGRTDIEFCWIGDGNLREEMTARNVTVTGWLSPAEVHQYYERAAVYLATSEWEGLPYAVLEAMNAGCALVLSNCGGHRDVVNYGENGYLYSSADEAADFLRTLIAAPELIARMGQVSQRLCREKFSAEAMATAYNALYLSITNERINQPIPN